MFDRALIWRGVGRMVAAAMLVGVGIGSGMLFRKASAPEFLLPVGTSLPEVVIRTVDGHRLTLVEAITRDAEHEFSVVILFSPKCASCFGEGVVWNELADKSRSARFVIIAVSQDAAAVSPFWNGQIHVPFYMGGEEVAREFRVPGSPAVFVADRQRKVIFASAGVRATNDLKRWLAQLQR